MTRWKTLPDGQRQGATLYSHTYFSSFNKFNSGIRNFIVNIILKAASDEVSLRKEKTYINKLNLALVQV